jgi:hypothetical protein
VLKRKDAKLAKSKKDAIKRQDHLNSPLILKDRAVQPTPKKRKTVDAVITEQVEQASPIAAGAYSSLLKDYVSLKEAFKAKEQECRQIQEQLRQEKKRRLQQECARAQKSANLWREKFYNLKKEERVKWRKATEKQAEELKRVRSCLSTTRSYHKKQMEMKNQAFKEAKTQHRKAAQDLN